MERFDVEYSQNSLNPGINKKNQNSINVLLLKTNNMHVIYMLIRFIYSKIFESGLLVSAMSRVREDIDGCAKQYMRDLNLYLMTVLSYSYGIIMDLVINAPGHWKNVFVGINSTEKRYLKGEIEPVVKLTSNDTSKVGMLPSDSKDVSIIFTEQFLHITNNKYRFNGLKGGKKM